MGSASGAATRHAWMAWFPVLQVFLMCAVAQRPWYWAVLFFLPLAAPLLYFVVPGELLANEVSRQ